MRAGQAGGVLPGAGLPEDVEAADIRADQSAIAAVASRGLYHLYIAQRGCAVLPDEINVALLLDQRLHNPGALRIGRQYHGQSTPGRDDLPPGRWVVASVNWLGVNAPAISDDPPALEKAHIALIGIVVLSLLGVGPVGRQVEDRVQAKAVVERLLPQVRRNPKATATPFAFGSLCAK